MNQTMSKLHKINVLLAGTVFFAFNLLWAKGSDQTKYSTIEVKDGGTISGVITFEGQMPALKQIEVNKDKKICGTHIANESVAVDAASKGIKNAVVFLRDIESGKKWSIADNALVMDQRGCMFSPHVLVVPAAQEFNMLNNDGLLHNVHTRSEINAQINKAQPRFLKRMKLSFEKPEFIKVTCDVHNWMQGWIVVTEDPYYVVTDDNGKFELTDVPAGSYTLEIWHEALGQQSKQVEVKAGKTTAVQISLK